MIRQKYTPDPGNWYDISARDNISPCRNIGKNIYFISL
jgi:hypothetical protein